MNRPKHDMELARDDESAVTVHYNISGGCPAQTYGPPEDCYPAEAPEVDIVLVTDASGTEITWTDAEEQRWCDYIIENHEEYEPEYGD